MVSSEQLYPEYGQRLLPQVLDWCSEHQPDRVYASCGESNFDGYTFREYSVRDVARATCSCAWWMKQHLGESNCFETVAYLGAADLRYPTLCLASIKCGWVTLLLGPRNSLEQNQSLLKRTTCTAIVYSEEFKHIANDLQKLEPDLFTVELPSLETLLSVETSSFPYRKAFAEAEEDPVLHIHSSGSTGIPKIITMTNGSMAVTDNDRNIPTPPGRKAQNGSQFDFENGGRFYTCFPPYHLAGVQAYLILPIFYNVTVVLGPPDTPPTGQLLSDVVVSQNELLKAVYVPSSIIEQWASTEEGIQQSNQLEFVLYGGGSLSRGTGDKLSQHTDVRQMYGSSEVGQLQLLVPQKGEWSYMEWNPCEEVDMQPNGQGTFEVVLHQSEKFRKYRSLSHNMPHEKVWRMGDLFTPHPTKPGLWKYHSRVDDLIVLSNSHKINPGLIETEIQTHPLVTTALVVGTGRPQPAVLLELNQDLKEAFANGGIVVDEVWSLINLLNQKLPAYARIARSKILVNIPEKPFHRTAKGTVSRKSTIAEYSMEIAALYSKDTSGDGVMLPEISLDGRNFDNIIRFLRLTFISVLGIDVTDDHASLFDIGMDSVKVFEALSMLKKGIQQYKPIDNSVFMPNLVYQHHTIADLSKRLHNLLNNSSGPDPEESQKNSNEMEKIIDLYTAGLPMRTNKILREPYIAGDVHNHAVLLTGSTGSLGSHVLRQLVKLPNVSKIYCFVRSRSVWRNHDQSHDDEHEGKIERVSVDYTRPRFGLSEDVYSQLLLDVNVIICLAWKVDFNVSLQAFEADCIHSIRAFVDFNLQSRLNPRIVFASSTIYALSHACIQGASTVPEDIISPPSIDTGTWYGQSKEVAERILAYSAEHSGVPVSILRLGQNSSAGEESSTSSWLNQEWIPSLIHTSKTLKVVPNLKTPINWVPVDRMANIILDLTFVGKDPSKSSDDENRARQASVYNIVHPRPIPWSRFAQVLSQMLPGCKIVTLRQWIEIVKTHSESSQHKHQEALKTIPAVKLISFFEYMSMHEDSLGSRSVGIITDKAISQSTALSSIPEIGDDSLEKWARM